MALSTQFLRSVWCHPPLTLRFGLGSILENSFLEIAMPRPQRSEQFCADEICVVHSIQRCVRKAWLAGIDPVSGVDYSFRKEWIRRRMEALASVFAIDILSYAIMSNHLHQILRNRPDVCAQWSDGERLVPPTIDFTVWVG